MYKKGDRIVCQKYIGVESYNLDGIKIPCDGKGIIAEVMSLYSEYQHKDVYRYYITIFNLFTTNGSFVRTWEMEEELVYDMEYYRDVKIDNIIE